VVVLCQYPDTAWCRFGLRSACSNLTIGGVAVNVNVGPNTTVDVAGVATLVLDEQLPVPGADKGLTVNALHLTGLGGAVDVAVASATSDAHNC
jgi:hypothetical protein